MSASLVLSCSERQPNAGLVYDAWFGGEFGNYLKNLYACDRSLDIQCVGGAPVHDMITSAGVTVTRKWRVPDRRLPDPTTGDCSSLRATNTRYALRTAGCISLLE